jgi:AhpD family alkylhydroperoxidase
MRFPAASILVLPLTLALVALGPAGSPTPALTKVTALEQQARLRSGGSSTGASASSTGGGSAARVALTDPGVALAAPLRLGGPDAPNYVRALGTLPQATQPLATLVHAVLYRGMLPTETKAAMGLRIAQVNASPYVAAHMLRVLRATAHGRELITALDAPTLGSLAAAAPAQALAVRYADALTRSVHGVLDDQFAETRAVYDDSAIVELTMTVAFFNFFTRYVEALHLPVEPWALDAAASAAPPSPNVPARSLVRVGLISDGEMAATSALAAAARPSPSSGSSTPQNGLGIGIANSQRAMMRSPEIALAWRAFGNATRTDEQVGRDIKLQVSFAVSTANECRYCTLHQVLGLRRLGVDPAKLVAMQKDDSALTPREAVAVKFARRLTSAPGGTTDADYAALKAEFGDRGALEVLLQTCTFAFMNRFTDGLRLPSEDEAVRVYLETYGTAGRHSSELSRGPRTEP